MELRDHVTQSLPIWVFSILWLLSVAFRDLLSPVVAGWLPSFLAGITLVFFAYRLVGSKLGAALVYGLFWSSAFEIVQLLPIGSTFDVADLVMGLVGAVVGASLLLVWIKFVNSKYRHQSTRM